MPGWRTVHSYNTQLPPCSPRPSLLAPVPGPRDWGEKGRAGVGRGTRFIAGNARHLGTRPGQPAIKGTLNTYFGIAKMAERAGLTRSRSGLRPKPSVCLRSTSFVGLSAQTRSTRGFSSHPFRAARNSFSADRRKMAERAGFEPARPFLQAYSLSRGALSAAQPPLLL